MPISPSNTLSNVLDFEVPLVVPPPFVLLTTSMDNTNFSNNTESNSSLSPGHWNETGVETKFLRRFGSYITWTKDQVIKWAVEIGCDSSVVEAFKGN
ncbi:hypothetical protein HDU76_000363 [Blyttiomyces sp. JEL0837]|nr:hypothetical protein HDU76_000363 [Blyttiomyces sp. JEL0837]